MFKTFSTIGSSSVDEAFSVQLWFLRYSRGEQFGNEAKYLFVYVHTCCNIICNIHCAMRIVYAMLCMCKQDKV